MLFTPFMPGCPWLLGVASLASILGAAFGLTVSARPSVLTIALAVGVFDLDTCGCRSFLDLSGNLKPKAEAAAPLIENFAPVSAANPGLTCRDTFLIRFAIVSVEVQNDRRHQTFYR